MASWSESKMKETTLQSYTSDQFPSLASIIQEQEQEQKRGKRRKTSKDHGKSDQHHGKIMEISWNFVEEDNSGQKLQSGWNPPLDQQRTPSLSTIMKEEEINPSNPPRFTFVPPEREESTNNKYTKKAAKACDRHFASSSGTKVVNVRKQSLRALGFKDLVDWLQNPDHVYIGRNMIHYVPGAVGSKWRNPFKMTKGMTRESCCQQYKQYIKSDTKIQANGKTLLQSLTELKGKTLGCWCHPELCHGHMLVQLIEEYC